MTEPEPPFADKPTLTGERVTLRPFTEADLPAMARAMADPEVARLTGSVTTTEEAESATGEIDEKTREWYLSRKDHADRLDLAVIDNATGACVGEVVLNLWDADALSCNFRILIGPDGRDRGLGSEATKLVTDYGFERGLHRVSLTVFAFNPRGRRAYEKAGFVVEGVAREAFRFDGEWIDDVHMARLATDPATGA